MVFSGNSKDETLDDLIRLEKKERLVMERITRRAGITA